MGALDHDTITVRRLELTFPDELDPEIMPGYPEDSFSTIGLSLLLPYLEPYLIRCMRAARPHIRDPQLLRNIELFNAQEGQHYRMHMRLNQVVRLRARVELQRLEDELEADYRRFSERRSLRFNLAYAEGFEAMTMAMSRFSFETNMIARLRPRVRELFEWHLVEELEHRTVTFDVYRHVFGNYLYRVAVSLFVYWHIGRFVGRVARVLGKTAVAESRDISTGSRQRILRAMRMALTHLVPKLLWTFTPWYSPHRIPMPANVQALAAHYTVLASKPAAASGGLDV